MGWIPLIELGSAVQTNGTTSVKVAVAYAIVGWILVEVSSVLGPALNLPDWGYQLCSIHSDSASLSRLQRTKNSVSLAHSMVP